MLFVLNQLAQHRKGDQKLRLLEAGCGDAYVASSIATYWPQQHVWGYDPFFDAETLQLLRDRYRDCENLKLIASLGDLPKDGPPINTVTLLDVIEHIEDEVAALREIRQHSGVAPDAMYLITVPAHQSLFSSHDVFMKHFRRYDKKLLSQRLAAAGLEVIEMRYFFFSLLLPRWLQVRREKKNPTQSDAQRGVSAWTGGRLKTGVLKSILVLDWKCSELLNRVGITLPGLSLYCLCRPAAS